MLHSSTEQASDWCHNVVCINASYSAYRICETKTLGTFMYNSCAIHVVQCVHVQI